MKKNLKIIGQSIKYVFKYSKICLFCYFLSFIFEAIEPLIYVIFSKYIINNLYPELLFDKAFMFVLIMVSLQFFCSFLNGLFLKKIEEEAEKILYIQKKKMIKNQEKIFYEKTENSIFFDDYYHADEYVNRGSNIHILNQIKTILSSIATIIGLIYLLKEVSIIAIAICIIIYFIKLKFINIKNKKVYDYSLKATNQMRKDNFFIWGFTNLKYAKENRLFNTFPYISKRLDEADKSSTKLWYKQLKIDLKYSIVPAIIDGLLIFIIYFSMVLSFKFKGLTIGDYSMLLAAFISFSQTINAIIDAYSAISKENFYFDKYNEVIKLYENTNKANKYIIDKIETIEFKNVSYKYLNSEKYALNNINLKISANDFKKISIVGKNGSGKSTFIKLLMKLYEPTAGDIYLNDINIKDIDNDTYYKLFSPVFQDYKIYNTTIKNNITFSLNESANDDLKKMELLDKVNSLSLKENTNISKEFDQEGIDFSLGERQKIAIARALHKDSLIMILDEPTASLSASSENKLYKMVANLNNKMVFFISHRLSSCRFTDKIIVFDNGNIKEIGSHDELINKNGIYSELFLAQAELYKKGGEEYE